MKIKKAIGWQKFEDILQSQLENPIFDMLLKKMTSSMPELIDEIDDLIEPSEEIHITNGSQPILPVDEKFIESVTLSQNFDCWMAHTNFDITKKIKDQLNKTEGIEILKVCSRYRFFIGIGRMFDFTNVRKSIEQLFCEEEDLNEKL